MHFGYGTTSTSKSIAHNISNLDYVVKYQIFWKSDTGKFRSTSQNADWTTWWRFYLTSSNIILECSSGGQWNATDLYVFIEHTKS